MPALRVPVCRILLTGLLLLVATELPTLGSPAQVRPEHVATHASLPLFFEANQGQADPGIRFLSHVEGYTFLLTPSETVLVEEKTQPSHRRQNSFENSLYAPPAVLRMKLVGANPRPELAGVEELPGKVNYLIGNDPHAWHTGVPLYSQVRSGQVYPGIDLVFHGNMHGETNSNMQQLEYDFIVAPGADPNSVRFRITGARKIDVDGNQDLVLHTADGQVLMHKPVIYQLIDGERRPVEGAFVVQEGDEVGFQLAAYDHRQPLVIDPKISFASFLGGAGEDQGAGAVLDASTAGKPKLYLPGATSSMTTFPEAHTLIGSSGGAVYSYIAKIDPTLTGAASLVYLTFIGGHTPFMGTSCSTVEAAIGLDASRGASLIEPVIGGATDCKDYPVTTGGPTAGQDDNFVTRLNPNGASLDTSILLGGNGKQRGGFVSVDSSGNVIFASGTTSTDLPATTGAYATKLNNGGAGTEDCFVAKLSRPLVVEYLTYLNVGAGTPSTINHIGCGAIPDPSTGDILAGGNTFSTTAFAVAGGANGFQKTFAGLEDTFLVKLNPALSGTKQLIFSSYLGGGGTTEIQTGAVFLGAPGLAVLGGNTTSGANTFPPDIPLTKDAYESSNIAVSTSGKGIGYVSVIDTTKTGLASLVFSSYFGGSGGDERVQAIAFDPVAGSSSAYRVVLGGQTTSANFPTKNPLQSTLAGGSSAQNAFVAVLLVPSLSSGPKAVLLFSTYIGGGFRIPGSHENETILGLAVDPAHIIYAYGRTLSDSFFGHTSPATVVNGFQPKCGSCSPTNPSPFADAVVFAIPNPAQTQGSSTSVTSSLNPSTFGTAVTFMATVQPATLGTPTGKVTFKDGTATLGAGTLSGRKAKFTTSSLAKGNHSITAVYGGDATFTGSTSPVLIQIVN
jgi:hypothetical protein